jgi:preprotein translocase subunit SecF
MNDHKMNIENAAVTQEAHKPLISKTILLICVALVAVAITAVTVFKVSFGSLFFIAALLACPLMHIAMMRGGGHKH